jgi:hypothetical protein
MPVRPFGKARLEEMYRKFDCLSKVAEERIWAASVFWLYFYIYIKLWYYGKFLFLL